jgi:hypothetical protein
MLHLPATGADGGLFRDITAAAGIDFTHVNGATGKKLMPETMAGGVAFLDYDRDGDQDLLFINSNYWPESAPQGQPPPTSALYRNRGDGSFEDVTAETGLDISMYGMGVAVGDYNGDGWEDIYITGLHENKLLRNDAGKGFLDSTGEAGVAGEADMWTMAAAFVDIDRDGDLDLLALNYVVWSMARDIEVPYHIMGIGHAYTIPANLRGTQPYLFENTGGGRFKNISATLSVNHSDGEALYKGLGIALVDIDDNDLPDIVVANDSTRNMLFRNLGDKRFKEEGIEAGIAFDSGGGATGAMGIDAAWRNNGQLLQLAIGNFAWEMSSYYVAESGQGFVDESLLSGFGPATRNSLTFGLFFFDYDLDGAQDLFHANGHVEPGVDAVDLEFKHAQSPQLFQGCSQRDCPAPFVEMPAGPDFSKPLVGRGAAYADIDGDGDQDIVIAQTGGPPRLLRNEQRSGNNWLRIRLSDDQRPVLCTQVTLRAGERIQRQRLEVSRSYLTSVEAVMTFGLGRADAVDELLVRWPDGVEQRVEVPSLNRVMEVAKTPPPVSGNFTMPARADRVSGSKRL